MKIGIYVYDQAEVCASFAALTVVDDVRWVDTGDIVSSNRAVSVQVSMAT